MRPLSKSKLLAFRQCSKRLWLEVHRPDLRDDSDQAQALFAMGHEVGEVARRLYDPAGAGTMVDYVRGEISRALALTGELLLDRRPIFEAAFSAEGALALADVLLPTTGGWRMVEVKSSTSVKDYHLDDVAVQAYVAQKSGLPLTAIAVAHIDSNWTYPGSGNYRGLLVEEDLTEHAFGRTAEVQRWIGEATSIASLGAPPAVQTGSHCSEPFECGFHAYCRTQEPQVEHPIEWLPRVGRKELASFIAEPGTRSMADVPDDLLNERQLRVKHQTLSGSTYFAKDAAAGALPSLGTVAHFLDFETVGFAIPIWPGTRPYESFPFQFSVHRMAPDGSLTSSMYLDLSGEFPVPRLAEALVQACGDTGPVFAYNAGFEGGHLAAMGDRLPHLKRSLDAIQARLFDLLPIAREHYYHPSQHGSWSIKAVLPAIFPDLDYAKLEGINEGGAASNGYLEAIHEATTPARKAELDQQLRTYCERDTFAMVKMWEYFAGRVPA